MSRGAASRNRRANRRASRPTGLSKALPAPGLNEAPHLEQFAATTFKDYPLSDRNAAWDAAAADAQWRSKSGSGDAPSTTYRNGFFWFDSAAADSYGSYKLGFVNVPGGTATAVWKGVTASAAAVQGARGGVKIPAGDVAGVKAHIGKYYEKAKGAYDDDTITVPWEASAETSAAMLARYEFENESPEIFLGYPPAVFALAHADALGDASVLPDRLHFWAGELDPAVQLAALAAEARGADEEAQGAAARAALYARSSAWRIQDRARALVAAGAEIDIDIVDGRMRTMYDLAFGSLPERCFYGNALALGLHEIRAAEWPCEAELGNHGEVLYRGDREVVFRVDEWTVARISIASGWLYAQVAAGSPDGTAAALAAFSAAYPPLYRAAPDTGTVPITFWTNGRFGPTSRLRMIDAQPWTDISRNYPEAVRGELAGLMGEGFTPGKDGQLLLWQGEPGTGKTWVLRALASEWREWAEFHYITDPDSFFVADPSYMIDVLLHETYDAIDPDSAEVVSVNADGGKWRVLILEDTGELLSAGAKDSYGQGLSRLLNVVDGMVGQGLKILVLVTTNDELGDLHPAAVRPGRCASRLAFPPFPVEEAYDWLGEGIEVTAPITLAEMYQWRDGGMEAFADRLPCTCGHAFTDHLGEAGPCTAECSCTSYEVDETAKAALLAAAGDVVWGPEDGFQDLMDDIDELLEETDESGPRGFSVRDVSLDLKKALVRDWDGDEHYVVPLAVGLDNEPTLGPFDEWVPAEKGWVEVAETLAGRRPRFLAGIAGEGNSLQILRDGIQIGTWLPGDNAQGGIGYGTFTLADTGPMLADEIVLPDEHQPGEKIPRRRPTARTPAAPASAGQQMAWEATFLPEGKPTDDGRIMAPNSIGWRELPLSLMGMTVTAEGHDGAEVCGRIDNIWRVGNLIRASGIFDDGEFGSEIARLVGEGTLRGLSVDLAIKEYELAYASEILDENGEWKGLAEGSAGPSLLDLFEEPEGDKLMFVVKDAVIGAATVCPFPAFADAEISLTASGRPGVWTYRSQAGFVVRPAKRESAAITAATLGVHVEDLAAEVELAGEPPLRPPAAWFTNPGLDELTPLTITEEGRVYGHAAGWSSCHTGFADTCVTPPSSPSGYASYLLGEIELDDGSRAPIGKITMGTGHANLRLDAQAAAAHYDNTGTAVADITTGEDEHGIWFAGALRPNVTPLEVRELRAATLSGDWRSIDGHRELIAVLAVNVPGFPVPRVRALVAAGASGPQVVALTASGIVLDPEPLGITPAEAERFRALQAQAEGQFAGLVAAAFGR